MEDIFRDIEPMVLESKISVPYSWWAGDTGTRFLSALRDGKKIIAPRCGSCGKVFVPPRKVCPLCFTDNLEWVELSGEGTLVSFTVVRRPFAALRSEVPAAFGLIRLDGADTAMLHRIGETDLESLSIGMRLKARFAEERRGRVSDIMYFIPA